MCRFRVQYQSLDDQWIAKLTLPTGQQSKSWELLEQTFLEYNKGIRFYFDELLSYESDMASFDNIVSYHSPK